MTLLNVQAPPPANHRAVAYMTGSLPMGGQVANTPVFSFHHTPVGLEFCAQPELHPQRRDISLDGLLAFEISNVLTAAESDALVAATEQLGYRDEAPGIQTPPGMRMNKSVHWNCTCRDDGRDLPPHRLAATASHRRQAARAAAEPASEHVPL